MTSIKYNHFSHISDLADTSTARGNEEILQSVLELYDHALLGQSYNSERNPHGMTAGRKQELIKNYFRDNQLVIASRGNMSKKALGIITFHTIETEAAWIDGLAVEEAIRGASIGRNLVERVEQHAQALHLGSVALRSAQQAVPFYESIGFTRTNDDTQPVFVKYFDKKH